MLSRMAPNYEMALLIAQVTGSVVVTDSGSRWNEMMKAQHRSQGIATYPWDNVHNTFNSLPIDEAILDTFRKSQGNFSTARKLLKTMDQMVVNNNRDPSKLANLAGQASDLMRQLGQVTDQVLLSPFKISSPEGGFYDVNVQRLLARSSCLRYDRYVRSVYGISIQD
ncbi:hypothetical protein [Aeromonas dhakensis]